MMTSTDVMRLAHIIVRNTRIDYTDEYEREIVIDDSDR